jgi:uncharacterized protein with HEPN domain
MSEREWRFYVHDMVSFCEKVLAFTQGLQQSQFVADAMCFDATVRNLELIGEAATHIPPAVRDAHPNIPWRMLIATRNQLIHGYLGLDNDILWNIVQMDVPVLLQHLIPLASEKT